MVARGGASAAKHNPWYTSEENHEPCKGDGTFSTISFRRPYRAPILFSACPGVALAFGCASPLATIRRPSGAQDRMVLTGPCIRSESHTSASHKIEDLNL